jgi:ABC-type Mn2+/Zn2+ transport system permease subunit
MLATLLSGPWSTGIERRALLEVVLLGAFCGPLSFWVSAYRLSYPSESLAHGLLPGLVVAALAGAPLLLGAGAGVALAAVAVALAGRDERIGSDTATAVVVTGAFGLGVLLALAPETPARLQELLFGDPLGVSDGDLAAAGVLAVAGGAALAALHRPLAAVALDPVAAAAGGIRPGLVRAALLLLLAAAVAVAVQGLGTLLVLAVLVAPAVAVGGNASGPGRAMAQGAAVAVLSGTVGLWSSAQVGGAAGASVALALVAAAALGSALRRSAARRPPPAAAT